MSGHTNDAKILLRWMWNRGAIPSDLREMVAETLAAHGEPACASCGVAGRPHPRHECRTAKDAMMAMGLPR